MALVIRPASECAFDQISLGEILFRLDPGATRITEMAHADVYFGGGEFNTSVGLSRVFGQRTAVCTAIVNTRMGQNLLGFIRRNDICPDFIKWREHDGVGQTCRNAWYIAERGYGVRGAVTEFDRGNTAASQLKKGDFNWDYIFGELGVRWLHTGGIFAGISPTTPLLVVEAMQAARRFGTIVSYDFNYRGDLWKPNGGQKRAQEVNHEIVQYVDVVFGNEEDYGKCLGFEVEGLDHDMLQIETGAFRAMIQKVVSIYPNLKVAATTLRRATTASNNDWSAILWHDNQFYESRKYPELDIYERIGGGDGAATGMQFGFLEFNNPKKAVDYGAALGAHNSTTPGDTTMATQDEVEKIIANTGARITR
jgi:2-dehydro-3-deoxygluconokinase